MIRRILLGAVALAALSGAAAAADLSNRQPMPPAPSPMYAPAFSWNGFYFGNYAGDTFGTVKPKNAGMSVGTINTNGFTGGAYAGYNYTVAPNVVLGVETEFGYNGTNGSKLIGATGAGAPITAKTEASFDGRLRARAGYSFGNLLVFGAGGWTYGDQKATVSFPSGAFPGMNISTSQTKFLNGWNLGLGADYALTNSVILRAEYIYDNMGSNRYNFGPTVGAAKLSTSDNTLRVGVAVKF